MPDSRLSVASESDSVQLTEIGVLRIAVATEKAGNSLDRDCFNRGTEALLQVARGELKAGAVLLHGTGANFCAGGNVRSFASAPDRPVFLSGLAGDFHEFVKALVGANLPVIGAIQGWAAGAGMSLVTHCDVAVGGTATKMRPAYIGIGLTPDGGLTWSLPRVVGTARARDIILTNRVLDAAEALDIGLLSQVVDDDQVLATAESAAAAIVSGPWRSIAATRALLSESPTATLADQLDAEAKSIAALSGLPEGIEGVDAFIGKRTPDYSTLNGS